MEALVGFILPPVIDFINDKLNFLSSKVRLFVSLVVCLIIAAVLNIENVTNLNWGNGVELLTFATLIFTEAHVVYKTYWEKSAPRAKLLGKV